jgi:hypothetical protein
VAYIVLLLLPAANAAALARALLLGYSAAGVAPHERALADAAIAARLSAVLLNLLEGDVQEQLDLAVGNNSRWGLLAQQRHRPWLSRPWPLDPADAALLAGAATADSADGIRQQLQQRFPGLNAHIRMGMCGMEDSPRAMQAAAQATLVGLEELSYDLIAGTGHIFQG